MRIEPIENIVPEMLACEDVFGYFTANSDGKPVVAYVKHMEPWDEDQIADGITDVYVVKSLGLFDEYLWGEADLEEYIKSHTWAWTFHPGKEVA